MNKFLALGGTAVFIFIFFFEWLYHGSILAGHYAETSELWRTQAEMGSRFAWLVLGQLILAIMFTAIFPKGYEGKGTAEGIRYGLMMGIFLCAPQFTMFAVAPYPAELVALWIVGRLLEFAVAGAILSLIYDPKDAHA